jgi:hypothetical protein
MFTMILEQSPKKFYNKQEGNNTFAVVPLRVKDTIVGTLVVVTRQHRDFTTKDIELVPNKNIIPIVLP